MKTFRPLLLVSFLALAACGDTPTEPVPGPDDGELNALSAAHLEAELESWVRRAHLDVANQVTFPGTDASNRNPALTASLTVLYPAPSVSNFAQAITGAGNPCTDLDFGYAKRSLALTGANVTDMASDIAAGNPVDARSFTFHSMVGVYTSAYAERTRVTHWSSVTGAVTVIGTTRVTEAPMVTNAVTVETSIPVTGVAGWAAGDSVHVEQWGVVGAAEPAPCLVTNQTTFWANAAGAQITF